MGFIVGDDPNDYIYNLICIQGETFTRLFTWTDEADLPMDLTGYAAAMKVRKIYPKTFLAAAYADSPVVSITTASGITLGGVAGTVLITITATTTAAIPAGTYDYDIELTITGNVTKLLRGKFDVISEATY